MLSIHMTKRYILDEPVYLKGLGKAAATEGGDLPVGNHTMTGVLVEDAASSVFPLHDVRHDGGLYVQDSEGAVVYKDGKAPHTWCPGVNCMHSQQVRHKHVRTLRRMQDL